MKRMLSLLLAIAMCLSLTPAAAAAEAGLVLEQSQTEPESALSEETVAAVQALIDALPSKADVTAEDYDAVQAAYDAYEALAPEQQAQITGAEAFEALFAWFSAQTAPLAESGLSWSTDGATATLNGFAGTATLTLSQDTTLVLEGDNTLTTDAGCGIDTMGHNLIIQGGGSLTIVSADTAIAANSAQVEIQSGSVRLKSTAEGAGTNVYGIRADTVSVAGTGSLHITTNGLFALRADAFRCTDRTITGSLDYEAADAALKAVKYQSGSFYPLSDTSQAVKTLSIQPADTAAAAVRVATKDGAMTFSYPSFDEALAAAASLDGKSTITLLKDQTYTAGSLPSAGAVLELGGNTLTLTAPMTVNNTVIRGGTLHYTGSASLTILTASSALTLESVTLSGSGYYGVDGGKDLTITDSTIESGLTLSYADAAYATLSGTLFTPGGDGYSILLTEVESGGSSSFAQANATKALKGMLKSGYAYYAPNGPVQNPADLLTQYAVNKYDKYGFGQYVQVLEHTHSFADGACDCGETCAHSSISPDTGKCDNCQAQLKLAKIGTTLYDTAEKALEAAANMSGTPTVVLLDNVTLNENVYAFPVSDSGSSSYILDLNNHALDAPHSVDVPGDLEMTITTSVSNAYDAVLLCYLNVKGSLAIRVEANRMGGSVYKLFIRDGISVLVDGRLELAGNLIISPDGGTVPSLSLEGGDAFLYGNIQMSDYYSSAHQGRGITVRSGSTLTIATGEYPYPGNYDMNISVTDGTLNIASGNFGVFSNGQSSITFEDNTQASLSGGSFYGPISIADNSSIAGLLAEGYQFYFNGSVQNTTGTCSLVSTAGNHYEVLRHDHAYPAGTGVCDCGHVCTHPAVNGTACRDCGLAMVAKVVLPDGTECYAPTMADAFAAVPDRTGSFATVTLLTNAEALNCQLDEFQAVNLDTNGFTLSGSLTVKGGAILCPMGAGTIAQLTIAYGRLSLSDLWTGTIQSLQVTSAAANIAVFPTSGTIQELNLAYTYGGSHAYVYLAGGSFGAIRNNVTDSDGQSVPRLASTLLPMAGYVFQASDGSYIPSTEPFTVLASVTPVVCRHTEVNDATGLCVCGVQFVAKVNDTYYYKTIQEALNRGSGTIKLLKDCQEAATVSSSTHTIDLNGKTWSSSWNVLTIKGGSVTLENGSLISNDGSDAGSGIVMQGGSLTLKEGMLVQGGVNPAGGVPALLIEDPSAQVTLEKGVILARGFSAPEGRTLASYLPAGTAFAGCDWDGSAFTANSTYIPQVYTESVSSENLAVIEHPRHTLSKNADGVDACPCGFTCTHPGLVEGQPCPVCGALPVAKIGSVYYVNVAEALNSAKDGETVQLVCDSTSTDALTFSTASGDQGVTLDLAGKALHVTAEPSYMNIVFNSGKLTVTDSAGGGWLDGGFYPSGGNVLITGGRFTYLYTESNVTLTGGTFDALVSSNFKLNQSLAPGYAFSQNGTVLLYSATSTDMRTENLTVIPCPGHTDGDNSGFCDYCNAKFAAKTIIGGTETLYTDLQEAADAVNAATASSTLVLLDDATLEGESFLSLQSRSAPSMTLDLNGKTLSGSGSLYNGLVYAQTPNVTIKNGTINYTGSMYAITLNGGTKTAVLEGITTDGAISSAAEKLSITSGTYGKLCVMGTSSASAALTGGRFLNGVEWYFSTGRSDLFLDSLDLLADGYKFVDTATGSDVYQFGRITQDVTVTAGSYAAPAVASIQRGGSTLTYTSLRKALADVKAGETVSLLDDVDLGASTIAIASGDFTLDLATHRLQVSGGEMFSITEDNLNLTIRNGEILSTDSYNTAISFRSDGGTLTLEGLSVTGAPNTSAVRSGTAIDIIRGTLVVESGTYTGGVQIRREASAVLRGGTFLKGSGRMNTVLLSGDSVDDTNAKKLTELLAPGCSYWKTFTETKKEGIDLSGETRYWGDETITVGSCDHNPDPATGACTVCGRQFAALRLEFNTGKVLGSYDSLEAALAELAFPDTVKMFQDAQLGDFTQTAGGRWEFNGHTLTLNGQLTLRATGKSLNLISTKGDSITGSGSILVAGGEMNIGLGSGSQVSVPITLEDSSGEASLGCSSARFTEPITVGRCASAAFTSGQYAKITVAATTAGGGGRITLGQNVSSKATVDELIISGGNLTVTTSDFDVAGGTIGHLVVKTGTCQGYETSGAVTFKSGNYIGAMDITLEGGSVTFEDGSYTGSITATLAGGQLSVSGGSFSRLTVQGCTLADLLAEGYGLQKTAGGWLTEEELAGTQAKDVTAKTAPLTSMTVTPDTDQFAYGGSATLTASANKADGVTEDVMYQWKLDGAVLTGQVSQELVLNDLTPGSYTVSCTAICGDYTVTRSVSLTVSQADLKDAVVVLDNGDQAALDGHLLFQPVGGSDASGQVLTQGIASVTLNGKALTKDVDYVVKAGTDTASDAGTHTLILEAAEGSALYCGSKEQTWLIAPLIVSAPTVTMKKVYDGTTAVTNVDVVLASPRYAGTLNFLQKGTHYTLSGVSTDYPDANVGVKEGLRATVNLRDRNYIFSDASRSWTVDVPSSQAEITAATLPAFKPGEIAVINDCRKTYTLDVSQLLPDLASPMDFGTITYSLSDSDSSIDSRYYTGGASIDPDTGLLTLPIQQAQSTAAETIGTVKVTVSTGNFAPAALSITINTRNRVKPTGEPTLTPASLTYGQPLSTIQLSGTLMDGSTPVPGTFTWLTPADTVFDAGRPQVQWQFVPEDGDNYEAVSDTVTIQVEQADTEWTAPTAKDLTYNGKAQALLEPGTVSGGTMEYRLPYTDWSTEVPTGTDKGTYTVYYRILGDKNHKDGPLETISVTMQAKDIQSAKAVLAEQLVYNTQEQTQALSSVTVDGLDVTYSVVGNTGTDAKDYEMILTGNGNFTGTCKVQWSIARKALSFGQDGAAIDQIADQAYTGSPLTPALTVRDGQTVLTEGTDYTVLYQGNTNAGTASVTVTLQGNYEGSGDAGFRILEAELKNVSAAQNGQLTYNGKAQAPAVTAKADAVAGQTVAFTYSASQSGPYTPEVPAFTDAGTYQVFYKAEAANHQAATGSFTATVERKDIGTAKISLGQALTYNTREQTQAIASVTVDSLDVTYSVVGNTGTDAKDYELILTGTGNFTGTCKAPWSIAKKAVSDPVIEAAIGNVYTGQELTPAVTVRDGGHVIPETEYHLAYRNNRDAGNAEILITNAAGGNYIVSGTGTFSIAQAGQSLTAADVSGAYGETGKAVQAQNAIGQVRYTVSDGQDVITVQEDTGHLTFLRGGTAKVTVSAAGDRNHEAASIEVTVSVAKAPVTIRALNKNVYTGSSTPSLSSPTESKDYTISGLLGSDRLTGVTVILSYPAEPDTSRTGSWVIEASVSGEDPRYAVTCENGTLRVETEPDSAPSGGTSVRIPTTEGGSAAVTPARPSAGETVTITVKPEGGYEAEDVTVKDSTGKALPVTDLGDGKYSFVMPDGSVTLDVRFGRGSSYLGFRDVLESDYFYEAVKWAAEIGVTTGVTKDLFEPNGSCIRAQAVTFLWRAAGSPKPKTQVMPFTDVKQGSYYEQAVLWAVENGITLGTSETTFSPDSVCTRAQIVTFLWRSRHQLQSGAANPFADVPAGRYYTDAVLWAVDETITTGTSKTTFSPDNVCTRAQIVTFLWRSATN